MAYRKRGKSSFARKRRNYRSMNSTFARQRNGL